MFISHKNENVSMSEKGRRHRQFIVRFPKCNQFMFRERRDIAQRIFKKKNWSITARFIDCTLHAWSIKGSRRQKDEAIENIRDFLKSGSAAASLKFVSVQSLKFSLKYFFLYSFTSFYLSLYFSFYLFFFLVIQKAVILAVFDIGTPKHSSIERLIACQVQRIKW